MISVRGSHVIDLRIIKVIPFLSAFQSNWLALIWLRRWTVFWYERLLSNSKFEYVGSWRLANRGNWLSSETSMDMLLWTNHSWTDHATDPGDDRQLELISRHKKLAHKFTLPISSFLFLVLLSTPKDYPICEGNALAPRSSRLELFDQRIRRFTIIALSFPIHTLGQLFNFKLEIFGLKFSASVKFQHEPPTWTFNLNP